MSNFNSNLNKTLSNLLNKPKVIVTLAGVLLTGCVFGIPRALEETVTATVTKTFVKDEKYLVYTDKGTFEVTDTLAYLRYNSSDKWGQIKVDTEYKITHTGVRFGLLSWYENIVKMTETKTTH